MDCRQLDRNELVDRYLTGQLDSSAQDEFEIHILQCAGCLQAVEVMQALNDELAAHAHEIRSQGPAKSVWYRWQFAAAFALLLIALGVGVDFSRHRGIVTVAHPNTPPPVVSAPPAETAKVTPDDKTQVAASVPASQAQVEKKSSAAKSSAKIAAPSPETPTNQEATNAQPSAEPIPPTLPTVVPEQKAIAELPLKSAPALPKFAGAQPANEEVAKELFRLGDVQVPPYTFSGFSVSLDKSQTHRRRGSDAAVAVDPGQAKIAEGRVYFQEAMGAYVEKNYARAAGLLEEAAQAEPNAADTNFYLGVCRLLLARPADALLPLTKVASANSSFTQSAHFYLAKAYIQMGDLIEAEEHLRAAEAISGRLSTQSRLLLEKVQAIRAKEQSAQ